MINTIIFLQSSTRSILNDFSIPFMLWQLLQLFILIAIPVLIFRWARTTIFLKKEQNEILKEISKKIEER